MKSRYLETIKAIDGKIYNLSFHQERYEGVLKSLGVTQFKRLQEYLNPPSHDMYRCRLVYTKDSIEVTYHLYKKREIKSLKLVYENNIIYNQKNEDRKNIDLLFLNKENADDVLIIKNNLVTDTSVANVAFFDGSRWMTPAKPLLEGTTRARLLEEGKIFARDISMNDLKNYTNIALLNAMIDFDILSPKNIGDFYC